MIVAYRLNYITKRKELIKDSIKIIISSIIMGLFIIEFKDINLIILVISSAFLYLIILFILKGIDNEDIKIIRNIRNTK